MKKFSFLLILCILLNLMVGLNAFAFSDNVKDFNASVNGINGQVSGVSYHSKWATDAFDNGISNEVANGMYGKESSDKSIKYKVPSEKSYSGQIFGANYVNSGTITVDKDSVSQLSVYVPDMATDGSGTILTSVSLCATTSVQKVFRILFKNNGTVVYRIDAATEVPLLPAYKQGQWYTIAQKFNISTGKTDIYIDGKMVYSDLEYPTTTVKRFDLGVTLGGTPNNEFIAYYDDAIFNDTTSTKYTTDMADRNANLQSQTYTVTNPLFEEGKTDSIISEIPYGETVANLKNNITAPSGGLIRVVSIDSAGNTTVLENADTVTDATAHKLVSINKSGGMRLYDLVLLPRDETVDSNPNIAVINIKGATLNGTTITVPPLTLAEDLLSAITMVGGDDATKEIFDSFDKIVNQGAIVSSMTVNTTSVDKTQMGTYQIAIANTTGFNVRINAPNEGETETLQWQKKDATTSPSNKIGFSEIYANKLGENITASVYSTVYDHRNWARTENQSKDVPLSLQRVNALKNGVNNRIITEFSIIPKSEKASIIARPYIITSQSVTRSQIENRSKNTGTNEVYFDTDGELKIKLSKSTSEILESYIVDKEYHIVIVEEYEEVGSEWTITYDTYINGVLRKTNTIPFIYNPGHMDRFDLLTLDGSGMFTGFKMYGVNSYDPKYHKNPIYFSKPTFSVDHLAEDTTSIFANFSIEYILPLNKDITFNLATGVYEENQLKSVNIGDRTLDATLLISQTIGAKSPFTVTANVNSVANKQNATVKAFVFDSIDTIRPYITPATIDKVGIK